jgi:hypothetical protein
MNFELTGGMRTAKVWEFVNAVKAREKVLRMERDDLD